MTSVAETVDLLTLDLDPALVTASEARRRRQRHASQFKRGFDPRRTAPFQRGYDPRRHVFTPEECARGGQASFAWLMLHKPWVLLALRKKLRQQQRQGPARANATLLHHSINS